MTCPGQLVENASLGVRNTLASPGVADYLFDVTSETQLNSVLSWARQLPVPVHVLGGGSNVLVPDRVPGLVLANGLLGYRLVAQSAHTVVVDVAAGENWHAWVCRASRLGWHGLENLALIPGTVGAAPVQNIGAYGVEVGDWIESVRARHLSSGEETVWGAEACRFAYRDSVFKQEEAGQWIILSVRFRLQCKFAPVLRYGQLADLPLEGLSPTRLINEVVAIRQSRLPDPGRIPNAGSFFTNPIVDQETGHRLRSAFPGIPLYSLTNGGFKVAAAWLIEQCGFKGQADPITGVGTWKEQSLILVNPQCRPMSDIMNFARRIQTAVHDRFGLVLNPEPQPLGRRST